jgi:hypothetical protein
VRENERLSSSDCSARLVFYYIKRLSLTVLFSFIHPLTKVTWLILPVVICLSQSELITIVALFIYKVGDRDESRCMSELQRWVKIV